MSKDLCALDATGFVIRSGFDVSIQSHSTTFDEARGCFRVNLRASGAGSVEKLDNVEIKLGIQSSLEPTDREDVDPCSCRDTSLLRDVLSRGLALGCKQAAVPCGSCRPSHS